MTRSKLHVAFIFALAIGPAAVQAASPDDGAQWPNLAAHEIPDPPLNPRPAFIDPDRTTARILGTATRANADGDITGSTARWPVLPPEPALPPEVVLLPAEPLSPFEFEVGTRYWYSMGSIGFAFNNGSPFFGNPTSTLDWRGMTAHSGEVFARVDHRPTGLFVKGVVGTGATRSGHIDDADYLFDQFRFSDTRSDVTNGNFSFAMADIGWTYLATPELRLGVFVGYHYWHEKVAANGIVCRQTSLFIGGCPFPGAMPVAFDVAVFNYEPTWHAVRLGVEGKITFADRWSLHGEFAVVPFAVGNNKDSHLLRQSSADLGPAPNIITDTRYAFGVETEVFINYLLTPNIELGAGLRYWGLLSRTGSVRFGPSFASANDLNKFDLDRYGILLQVKGKF